MSDIIAERTLFGRRSGDVLQVHVRLHAPIQRGEHNDWVCRVEYEGDYSPASHHEAWGTDGFQAIIVALQMIGRALDESGMLWTANADVLSTEYDPETLDDGFPRDLYLDNGLLFRRRLMALCEAELARNPVRQSTKLTLKNMIS